MRPKYDPIYRKVFSINTPITYTDKLCIQKKIEPQFKKDWRRFYPRAQDGLSATRKKALTSFMKKIQKIGNDHFSHAWVSIRYIDREIGFGVFANCNLPPYKTIVHYAGILRFDKDISSANDSAFNFTKFSKYSIDGWKCGNWSRFMNHEDLDSKRTNVVPWELYLPEGPRIIFTTGSKGVRKGEQLLYSYGDSYWEEQ